nr:hypothetical protein [Tanacetum cinerariifolium]
MAPRRTTRSTADQETVNATMVTNAQLQAMIDQGVTAALAARDALRSTNGDDSHNSEIEADKIEKYVGSLPDMIHGCVVASKPKTMQEAIKIATELKDKKIRTFAERETASKKKFKNTSRNQEAIENATELMDKKIRTFAERETASKRKIENTSRTTRNQQQQHSNKDRTPAEFTPQHLVKRSNMGDPNPYALNAIITTTVHVLLSATTATKLVILHVTVVLWQIPIILTIRGALGQDKNQDVMSVEFKDILEKNVPS